MREIKFRAWSNFEELMSYDVTVYANGWYRVVFPNGYEAKYTPDSGLKIMQYTGLKDENGKEIYEGDIWDVNGRRYVVKFDEYRAGIFPFADGDGCGCCSHDVYDPSFGEIIGNIYENKNLLED